jgi:hypothetical protein
MTANATYGEMSPSACQYGMLTTIARSVATVMATPSATPYGRVAGSVAKNGGRVAIR